MNHSDRPDFLRIINGLAALYRVELTAESLSVWWGALASWTLDEFRGAASYVVRLCKFMPTPYDFERLRKSVDESASEAWLSVLQACKRREALPPGRTARALEVVGGMYVVAMCDIERELPHVARRFRTAFEELTDVETARLALAAIADNTGGDNGGHPRLPAAPKYLPPGA